MTSVSVCPKCQQPVTVPSGVDAAVLVRCPLCEAEYPLAEALPPALIPIGDKAEAVPFKAPGVEESDNIVTIPVEANGEEIVESVEPEESPELEAASEAIEEPEPIEERPDSGIQETPEPTEVPPEPVEVAEQSETFTEEKEEEPIRKGPLTAEEEALFSLQASIAAAKKTPPAKSNAPQATPASQEESIVADSENLENRAPKVLSAEEEAIAALEASIAAAIKGPAKTPEPSITDKAAELDILSPAVPHETEAPAIQEELNEAVLAGVSTDKPTVRKRRQKPGWRIAVEATLGGLAGCLVTYYGFAFYYRADFENVFPKLPLPGIAYLTTPAAGELPKPVADNKKSKKKKTADTAKETQEKEAVTKPDADKSPKPESQPTESVITQNQPEKTATEPSPPAAEPAATAKPESKSDAELTPLETPEKQPTPTVEKVADSATEKPAPATDQVPAEPAVEKPAESTSEKKADSIAEKSSATTENPAEPTPEKTTEQSPVKSEAVAEKTTETSTETPPAAKAKSDASSESTDATEKPDTTTEKPANSEAVPNGKLLREKLGSAKYLGPRTPKQMTSEQLGNALDAVIAHVAADPDDAPALEAAYKAFCNLGEAIVFANGPASDTTLSDRINDSRKLLETVLLRPEMHDEVAEAADAILQDDTKQFAGIMLTGTIKKVAQQGHIFGMIVQLSEQSKSISVLTQHAEKLQEGDQIAVLGIVVRDPSSNLVGYSGNKPEVVWAELIVEAP